jgi:hypothetical protein
MARDPKRVLIYHITHIDNLPSILKDGGLHSDAVMAARDPKLIGYSEIKKRRLNEIHVPCCNYHYVGDFVPFYFCPRSPMLFTINKGNTGYPPGCQRSILHLVSTMDDGLAIEKPWAISSGNAGAYHTTFAAEIEALDSLDWEAIRATQWQGKQHQKMAEFLVRDFFPWTSIKHIGCFNSAIATKVSEMLNQQKHRPPAEAKSSWYYF